MNFVGIKQNLTQNSNFEDFEGLFINCRKLDLSIVVLKKFTYSEEDQVFLIWYPAFSAGLSFKAPLDKFFKACQIFPKFLQNSLAIFL